MITLSRFAVGLLFISSASAFFRLPCSKPVLNANVDPIVSPGVPSSHSHTIMGSGAIGPSTTFADLRNSNCSTCKVKDDLSNYWANALFYRFGNGTYQAVPHGGMLVYYLQRPSELGGPVEPFPDGFRMVTGNQYARSYKDTPEAKAISWKCIDFNAHDHEETSDFGDTNCPDGLRAQIFFPSCWDGKNVDSPDHKSHMAYPSGINSGTCPDTHPVRLISLFYEIWHWVRPYNQLNDGGQFIMSTGDPTGHSLHGDFINGWDHTILQRVTDTCTNLSGVIEDCGVLQNENRFFTDDQMNACSAQNPYPEDEVSYGEVLKYLPGCVAVTSGPGDASPNDLVPGCKAAGVGTVGVGLSGDPAPNPSNSSSSMGPTSTPPTANPGPSSSMTSMSSAASGSPGYSDSPASSVTPATSGSQDYSDSPNPSTSPAASGSQGYSDSPNPSTSPAASGSQGYSDSPNSYTPPAASGSQGYSGSPIPPAWPTSSHDCGDHDHSAYPSSSMAPIRRHHKRGHASPRHF